MKYIAIVIVVALTFIGCDPVKNLDWNRTVKEQRLRVGNQVKVDALVYNLPVYELKKNDNSEIIWVKKNWDTTLDLWVYNPNAEPPENDPYNPINPNAAIGTVICTIYNPMHNEILMRLRDMYPDTVKLGESSPMKRRFEITGRIHSFKRDIVPSADDTQPDISLTAVRIHVESLTHIESIDIKE